MWSDTGEEEEEEEEEEEGRPNRMFVEAAEAKVTWHLCCVNY